MLLTPMFLGRVTCSHCGHDEVAARAVLKVGSKRVCNHCGRTFVVHGVRALTDRRAPSPPKTKRR